MSTQLSLKNYAHETYAKYKDDDYFHAMICTIAHSFAYSDPKLLVQKVNSCTQTQHKKVTNKRLDSFLDSFSQEGLITFGMDKEKIVYKPTALSKWMLRIYQNDSDVGKHHRLPNF